MIFTRFKNVIGKIKLILNFKKVNSPSLVIKNKAEGVTTQFGQVNIRQGLTYTEVKDLVNSVLDQKLVLFKDEAKNIYDKRVEDFKRLFIEKIKNLPNEEVVKLKDPDTQLTLFEASKISGRKHSEELRDLLANLVINRIKNDKTGREELKNIVYNEAISTVGKITIDQLKIITLCYLLRYTTNNGIISWDLFRKYLNDYIKPFMEFKDTRAEFQHIEYAGCGSIGIMGTDLINLFRQQYSFLFFNLIERNEIDSLDLEIGLKNNILTLDAKENKYNINFKNKTDLENYLKKMSVSEEIIKKITTIYEKHTKKPEEVKKMITEETNPGLRLLELWDKSNLKVLSLTSVGIVIGASYFEQITGEKVDIGIWIN